MPIALLEAGTGGCRLALCGTCAVVCGELALAVLGAVGVGPKLVVVVALLVGDKLLVGRLVLDLELGC